MRTVTAAAHNPHPSPSPSPSPLSLTPSFERAPTLLTPIVPDDADDDDDDPEEDRKKGDSLAVTVSHSGLNRRGRDGAGGRTAPRSPKCSSVTLWPRPATSPSQSLLLFSPLLRRRCLAASLAGRGRGWLSRSLGLVDVTQQKRIINDLRPRPPLLRRGQRARAAAEEEEECKANAAFCIH